MSKYPIFRINVNFLERVYRKLEAVATRRQVPISDVLRDAVILYDYCYEAVHDGRRLVVMNKDGSIEPVDQRFISFS
jgi:hypothetical protein